MNFGDCTQAEYMAHLRGLFETLIESHALDFAGYCYNNHKCIRHIEAFKAGVKEMGLELSTCYHAHGIGNNNEYKIYREEKDEDGFVVQKQVAELYYCYGIFGGCMIQLKDLATNSVVARVGHAS